MGAMSDLQLELVETIEDILCEKLCMFKCQMTYEVSLDIFRSIVKKVDPIIKTFKEE